METELKYEEKFIVINRKRLGECSEGTANQLLHALERFVRAYEIESGKIMDQKYLVCNQDEPYAEKVLDLILHRHPEPPDTRMREALEEIERLSKPFLGGGGYSNGEKVYHVAFNALAESYRNESLQSNPQEEQTNEKDVGEEMRKRRDIAIENDRFLCIALNLSGRRDKLEEQAKNLIEELGMKTAMSVSFSTTHEQTNDWDDEAMEAAWDEWDKNGQGEVPNYVDFKAGWRARARRAED